MLSRTLILALGLGFALALTADAQTPYHTLDQTQDNAPGVRLGIGIGPFSYFGPNILYGSPDDQENVSQTRLGVTANLSFPLVRDKVYFRAVGGLLNIGASEVDGVGPGQNPFLTNELLLAEGDLILTASHRRSNVVPYIFSGFGALIADPFGQDDFIDTLDRERTAYFIPAGLGVDFRLSRNVSFYLEGSYRFLLNELGEAVSPVTANSGGGGDPCEVDPDGMACKCKKFPELPECKEDPDVDPEGDFNFDNRFHTTLFTGGLNFGFGGAPPPPPPIPCYVTDPGSPACCAEYPNRPECEPEPPCYETNPGSPACCAEFPNRPECRPEPEPCCACNIADLNTASFSYGEADLSPDALSRLDENIRELRENPDCHLLIRGYTDNSELDRYGTQLGRERARAVFDYYLDRGISRNRMRYEGGGARFSNCDKENPNPGNPSCRIIEITPACPPGIRACELP